MKQFFLPLSVCALLALLPTAGHAQQPRARLAARPTASPSPSPSPGRRGRPAVSPTPQPTPTPTIIPAAPLNEMNELSPPSDAAVDAPVSETVIEASDGATFASKDRIAVFSGNVKVTDPRFQLSCDKLTVFLNKSAATPAPGGAATPPAAGSTPAPLASASNSPPAPAPDANGQGGGGGIDHCVAEGHVIILQKRAATKPGEEDKISIGRGDKGTFDNKSGDMVLYGMPEIEQNGNKHSATSPSTIMTIHKDSSLDTKGPNTTTLMQHKGSGGGIEMPGVPTTPDGGKPKKAKPGATPQASQG